ncbi:MAG: hypothetical protein DME50_16490 [Verrucomicrobia bacterium]|nr:MAG: hypothetical protein DME50_16490 [Verrucomicrobiota bacterium]
MQFARFAQNYAVRVYEFVRKRASAFWQISFSATRWVSAPRIRTGLTVRQSQLSRGRLSRAETVSRETPSALAILNLAVTGGACVDDALLNHQWTKFFCDVSVWVAFSAPDQR